MSFRGGGEPYKGNHDLNMTDPATAPSRIYVGNLPINDPNFTKTELGDMFAKYGKVLGASMNRGFGFVQFESESSAVDAISQESGTMFRGKKIDVKQARVLHRSTTGVNRPENPRDRPDNNRDHNIRDRSPVDWRDRDRDSFSGPDRSEMDRERGPGPMDRDRGLGPMDRERGPGPMDRERGLGPMDRERGPGPMDRERGSGSIDRDRGPMDRGPMDRGHMDRGPIDRGPMDRGSMDRGPMDRGPMDRSHMDRGPIDRGPMDRGPMDRGLIDRGPMDRGPMDRGPSDRASFYGKSVADSFRGGPPSFRPGMGDLPRSGPTNDYGTPPNNVPAAERTNDLEIIVVNKSNREYGEYIERRLKQLGLSVDLLFPNEISLGRVLANISSRGTLYAIVVLPLNEEHRSLTLNILHGLPQEHRNMPLEDAVKLISRNFEAYVRGEKSGGGNNSVPTPISILPASIAGVGGMDRHPEPIRVLLKLLSDDRQLTVLQYDKVIRYLEQKRELQVKIELGDSKDVVPTTQVSTKQEVELQNRILNILNSSNSASAAVTPPVSAPITVAPVAKPAPAGWSPMESATSNPLLSDPTVQKALDSLLQGNLLKNITAPQSFTGRF